MSFRSIAMTLTGQQPTSLAEWKIQCGRVITLLLALVGLIFSLSVIFTCDFFHTSVTATVETSTGGEASNDDGDRSTTTSTFYVSVGLFGYATIADSSFETTDSSASCRWYDPSAGIVKGGLRLAQVLGVMAPIICVFGCLGAVLDTWVWKDHPSRLRLWILVLNWLVATATQFFSYVALQENEFCQGEGGFGECQLSSGALMAVFAMIFYFLSLVATIGTIREQVRAKAETMYGSQDASNMWSGPQPNADGDGDTSYVRWPDTTKDDSPYDEIVPVSEDKDGGDNKAASDSFGIEVIKRSMRNLFGVTLFNSSQEDDCQRGYELKDANTSTDTAPSLPTSDTLHTPSRSSAKSVTMDGNVTPCGYTSLGEDRRRGDELKEAKTSTDTVAKHPPTSDTQKAPFRSIAKSVTMDGNVTSCGFISLGEDQQD